MTTKKLLSLQLKRLLSSVADHGNQHLSEVETDLIQTNILLGEAIEKLSASFMAIHASVCTQQEMVSSLLVKEGQLNENAARIQAASVDIGLQINAAITGLQFQDMTNQLICRGLQRLAGLSKVLEILGNGSTQMGAETGIEEIVEVLGNVNHLLEHQSGKLESDLWKTVCQTHMESGDIELF